LLKVDGEVGHLITNHHVIVGAPKGAHYPEVTVVFNSGTDGEKVVKGQVLASSHVSDLAVLRVTGVKDLPRPIRNRPAEELTETTPVVVFGFPATGLDRGKNPPVTVTRGAVSSTRRDGIVQLDTLLNPGNSGGPVVDTKGRLVGIAFARAEGKGLVGIGYAVPPGELPKLLAARIQDYGVVTKAVHDGEAEIEISLRLHDPYETIRAVAVDYAAADLIGDAPVSELPGAKRLTLDVKHQKAVGTFKVRGAKPGIISYYCQPSADVKGLAPTKPLAFHVNFKSKAIPPGD